MKKYKVCVYAISKNEEQFVDRWYQSMKEADEIYVLDTGSSDNTVNKLKDLGVHVEIQKITPWRFDVARNQSLSLVPLDTEICVCTDLDEVFVPGWREELEKVWSKQTTRIGYNYNWLIQNGKPIVNFYIEKIHNRLDYKWTHPVHEILEYIGNNQEIKILTDSITVNHFPDTTKSRSSYLPLLELSVKEDPSDDRNMHYLGREYMYYKKYKKAIATLKKHLRLPKATWKDERCASMRFIARCYLNEQQFKEANKWADKAIKEAPYLRDPYMEKALIAYQEKNWKVVINNCLQALMIKKNTKSYINEVFCSDEVIYDLLSIAFYNEELYEFSYTCIQEAIQLSPYNPRLLENFKFIQEKRK